MSVERTRQFLLQQMKTYLALARKAKDETTTEMLLARAGEYLERASQLDLEEGGEQVSKPN